MKIFLSQPMKDKTDEEIQNERDNILAGLQKEFGSDIELIDSFFQGAPHDARPVWFLGKSLELLSTADLAIFAKGWQQARGCRLEHEAAVQYGIQVVEM